MSTSRGIVACDLSIFENGILSKPCYGPGITRLFQLGARSIGKKCGISGPKTTAVIRFIKLKDDQSRYREFTIGKSKFQRYSSIAIQKVQDALKNHSIDDIWRSH